MDEPPPPGWMLAPVCGDEKRPQHRARRRCPPAPDRPRTAIFVGSGRDASEPASVGRRPARRRAGGAARVPRPGRSAARVAGHLRPGRGRGVERDRREAEAHTRPGRVRWLRARPEAALCVDAYSDDWSELAWVQLLGRVAVLAVQDGPAGMAALRTKYEQYAERRPPGPLLRLEVERALSWRAAGEGGRAAGRALSAWRAGPPARSAPSPDLVARPGAVGLDRRHHLVPHGALLVRRHPGDQQRERARQLRDEAPVLVGMREACRSSPPPRPAGAPGRRTRAGHGSRGSAMANSPAPGGCGGAPLCSPITRAGTEAPGLRSGAPHTDSATRPPSRRTRRVSRAPPRGRPSACSPSDRERRPRCRRRDPCARRPRRGTRRCARRARRRRRAASTMPSEKSVEIRRPSSPARRRPRSRCRRARRPAP